MKLVFCQNCGDIVRLQPLIIRKCECGKSWGQYASNGWHAVYGGKFAVPLLISNTEIVNLVNGHKKKAGLSVAKEDHTRFIHEKKAPQLRCKTCKTVVYSLYRHDFNSCECGAISLNGGFDYSRISGKLENIERKTKNVKKTKTQKNGNRRGKSSKSS